LARREITRVQVEEAKYFIEVAIQDLKEGFEDIGDRPLKLSNYFLSEKPAIRAAGGLQADELPAKVYIAGFREILIGQINIVLLQYRADNDPLKRNDPGFSFEEMVDWLREIMDCFDTLLPAARQKIQEAINIVDVELMETTALELIGEEDAYHVVSRSVKAFPKIMVETKPTVKGPSRTRRLRPGNPDGPSPG